MMISRKVFASTAALAGLAAALAFGGPTVALADEPCVELNLSGNEVLKIPCPEDLGRLLDPLLLPPQPGDDGAMAIDPEWPWDQAMVAERDWPHDRAMVHEDPTRRRPQLDDFLSQAAESAIRIVRGIPTVPIRLKPVAPQ